jgi:hypothetical protein
MLPLEGKGRQYNSNGDPPISSLTQTALQAGIHHETLLTYYQTAAVADKKSADAKSHGTARPGAAS